MSSQGLEPHALVHPDHDLAPALAELARRVRDFAQRHLAPHARRVDEEGRFRIESVREMAEFGLLGGPLPERFGGRGWSPLALAVAHEEVGAVCGNSRGFLAVHTGLVAQCIERHGSEEQQTRWLPRLCRGETIGCFAITEEEAGSDVAALSCRAEPHADSWRLFGKKIWITNGGIAQLGIVFATIDRARGKDGITAFLVELERPGLQRLPMPGKELGHRGSDHAQLVFDGFEAPGGSLLGAVGAGFGVAMDALGHGRLSVAAGAVGIHRAALQASIDFVKHRRQFGRAIAEFQMVQERIADMTVELLAARALVHRAAARREAGMETPGDIAAAKLYATEAAGRAVDQAVLLHGARGYSNVYPVERLLRDSMGLRIYEGTTLIQKSILARAVLRD